MINLGQVTLVRRYDVEKTQNPQSTKDITDDAANHVLEMHFAKKEDTYNYIFMKENI